LIFHPDRWALAFVNACGEDVETGLSAFKALFVCLSRLPEPVTGDYSSRQLERMIRRAAAMADSGGKPAAAGSDGGKPSSPGRGLEMAIRVILLLVKRGNFRQGLKVITEVENLLDRKRGLLRVTVEAAFPPDTVFEGDLKTALLKKAGVTGVAAEVRVRPELLGGVRLIIGDEVWDASLRGRLQNMAGTLGAASCGSGGDFV
jgi:F-type H+-transporting ATPase subunit delta